MYATITNPAGGFLCWWGRDGGVVRLHRMAGGRYQVSRIDLNQGRIYVRLTDGGECWFERADNDVRVIGGVA